MSGGERAIPFECSTPFRRVAPTSTWLPVLACIFGLSCIANAEEETPDEPVIPVNEPAAQTDETLFSIDSPLGAIEYVAGRGLKLGRTRFTIGGFTTLEIDREEGQPGVFELDGINFLVLWEPLDFFRGFAEIELGKLFTMETNSDHVESDPEVEIERLFADLSRSDALNLRVGKFQTPVGRWNLVPAEPFVWTATEPIQVETAFDEHQTGGAFFGSVYPSSNNLSYWLYGQFIDPLDPSDDPDPTDRSVGGRLEYTDSLGKWSVGSSFLASELDDTWSYLGGLDAFLRVGPLELQSEFVLQDGDIPDRDLWGIYVQGVADLRSVSEILRGLYLVGRYEHFDPSGSKEDANIWNVGLTWLPVRFLNIKAGYQLADKETEEVRRGLFVSVSVLF